MKLGIVGPTQAGKTTVLSVLAQQPVPDDALAGKAVTKMVSVPDARLEQLREVYQPKSFKPAVFTVVDFGVGVSRAARVAEERAADAFLVVVPAFDGADPVETMADLDVEWVLEDLQTVERRIDKIKAQVKKPVPTRERDLAELPLFERCATHLSNGAVLRDLDCSADELASLRHYSFFTLKPRLVVVNLGEDDLPYSPRTDGFVPLCAPLEAELSTLAGEDRLELQAAYGIEVPARDRLVQRAYDLLGLRSFFTVGPDEVRAWTIEDGTCALEAAGVIHSDLQRGFIRAETVSYADFVEHASDMKRVKAAGRARLEGKTYVVQDGDMMDIRFNV